MYHTPRGAEVVQGCREGATPNHTPQPTGSSEAATWSFFAAGLVRIARGYVGFLTITRGLGILVSAPLCCRRAPIGVGHDLFVLSDDQLTRVFHSANNALCCASQTVCVVLCRACAPPPPPCAQNYWDRHRFVNAIAAEVGLGLQYHEESTAAALRALGARYAVEVCEAPAGTDADVSVVALCRQQRRSVAAVLGADNDLMLMPHRCRVVTYRLGLDEARRVRVDLNHVVDTCAVARLLGGEGRMPLFATLVGCDYSDCFFQYRQARAGSIRGKNPHRFEVVAALVKKLCTGRLQGGELEDELAKAWAAEDARAPGSPETEDLDSDGSEAELALDGACDPDGAGDFAGARDAAAAAPVRGDAGPDHGPGSGPGPIDAAADSDAAAADTGDGVADVQVTVQEVLQTLAARIKTTSQRRTFLEDAAEAVRFFCANTGGVQVLRD